MKKILFVLLTALLLTNCDDDGLSANGRTITETRNLEGFDKLNINAGKSIKLMYGTQTGITITGSDNLVRHLRSSVSNGQLTLDYDQDHINHEDIEVTITMPHFKELRMNGKRTLNTYGTFDYVSRIVVVSHGENDITSGDAFEAENLDINLTGTGKVDFRTLASERVKAEITGDGKIFVKAELSIHAKILGNGQIYYLGHPQITSDITGNGSISSL